VKINPNIATYSKKLTTHIKAAPGSQSIKAIKTGKQVIGIGGIKMPNAVYIENSPILISEDYVSLIFNEVLTY